MTMLNPRRAVLAILIATVALASAAAQAQSADIAVMVVDGDGRPVQDAVVVAMPVDGKVTLPAKPREEIVEQIDKEFAPRVKPVIVGTAVRFPNHDDVRHHVYSFSGAKHFELPLYAGVPALPVVFDKAGVVILGCNIHDWMVGYIYVSESPYFAKTNGEGKAILAGLPAQSYVLRVWHPQLEGSEDATRKTVDIAPGRAAVTTWTINLGPEIKVRRAPIAGHGLHY